MLALLLSILPLSLFLLFLQGLSRANCAVSLITSKIANGEKKAIEVLFKPVFFGVSPASPCSIFRWLENR